MIEETTYTISVELQQRISGEQSYQYRIVPFKEENGSVFFYSDTLEPESLSQELLIFLGYPVTIELIDTDILNTYLSTNFRKAFDSEKQTFTYTQDFLEKKYRRRAIGKRIFSQKEMPTKTKYGRKRADGFLAFRHFLWGEYVVSMEAKSKKTLPAIRPYRDDFVFVINSLKFGFYCCIGTGAMYALVKWEDQFWQFLLPFYVLMISALVYALFTWNSYRHQTMNVIDQLRQYPANEQWLAFSRDSIESLPIPKQKILRRICRARGIGLVVFGKRIRQLEKPKYRWNMGKSFLNYYSKEDKIRKYLFDN